MARVNTDILGISKLKCTGMGEFHSDDHYIYYCGQEIPQMKWSSHHMMQVGLCLWGQCDRVFRIGTVPQNSFIQHAFNKYLSNAYSMPGTTMDDRDAVVIKNKNPFSSEGSNGLQIDKLIKRRIGWIVMGTRDKTKYIERVQQVVLGVSGDYYF